MKKNQSISFRLKRGCFLVSILCIFFLTSNPVYSSALPSALSSLTISYTPNDDHAVSSCSLWTNISGSFAVTQTNNSITMGASNIFTVSHVAVGSYKLQITCLDNIGQTGFSGYAYIVVTTTAPSTTTTTTSSTSSTISTTTTTHGTTTTNCMNNYAWCGYSSSGVVSPGGLCLGDGLPDCDYASDNCVAWTPPDGICCPPGYACGYYNGGAYMCQTACHTSTWSMREWVCNSDGSWSACP